VSEAYTMHPADIKALIKKAGQSQSEIARKLPGRGGRTLTVGSVYLVIEGQSKSSRIAQHISKLVGVPVGKLWPGKYPEIEFLEALTQSEAKAKAKTKRSRSSKGVSA
jgi:lambda repressor-like predicted transcriptional regulator